MTGLIYKYPAEVELKLQEIVNKNRRIIMAVITSREINKLSVAERILLAEKIWESIPENSQDLDLSKEQKQEIDRRLDSLKNGTARVTSWSEVKNNLHARREWK